MVINCYLGVIMLWWVHELSNISHALLWFFGKPGSHLTIQLWCLCHIVFALYYRKNIVPNWWHYYNPTCCRYTVINWYLSVIMLWQVHEPSNIWHHYCNFLANLVASSQSSYDVLTILYLLYITERILYLFGDMNIILHVTDIWL